MRLRAVLLAAGVLGAAAPAQAATFERCGRIADPYPGTRYEGVPLSGIRAFDVPCDRARRVARGAHRKGLGLPPSPSGTRRYRWRGWRVTADLRGPSDRYVARSAAGIVRWRF